MLDISLNYEKSLLVGVQCFNRNVLFHRKSADLNDFSCETDEIHVFNVTLLAVIFV